MDDYREFREAARTGITEARCEPVLVEDKPSLDASSRNACLDGVESCDAVVVIIGPRGGWTAPSGRLVVDEEFEHARGRGIPTMLFIQEGVELDSDAKSLAGRLSGYINGRFRRTFETPEDLAREVKAAVDLATTTKAEAAMNLARLEDLVRNPADFGQSPVLRVVVSPSRQGETVVEVEKLDDEGFRHDFVHLGVERSVGLFDQNASRQVDRRRTSLVVEQGDPRSGSHANPPQRIRVEFAEDGSLVLDLSLEDQGARSFGGIYAFSGLLPLAIEDLAEHAGSALRFAQRVYEHVDPYDRHVGLLVNASLGSLGQRRVTTRNEVEKLRGATSMSMPWRTDEQSLPISFTQPERISRTDAEWTTTLPQKISARLERFINTE